MNDCDWIAARTLSDAIDCYLEFSGASRADVLADEPHPLSDADLARLTFVSDDEEPGLPGVHQRHAFAVELQRLIHAGVKFPRFFASTEF
jgi:hypothetical protein